MLAANPGLTFLFASKFFTFPNTGAVLGIEVPGVGGGIPIEAVFVWMAVCFVTVIIFEVVKIWQQSGKNLLQALRGDE